MWHNNSIKGNFQIWGQNHYFFHTRHHGQYCSGHFHMNLLPLTGFKWKDMELVKYNCKTSPIYHVPCRWCPPVPFPKLIYHFITNLFSYMTRSTAHKITGNYWIRNSSYWKMLFLSTELKEKRMFQLCTWETEISKKGKFWFKILKFCRISLVLRLIDLVYIPHSLDAVLY